MLVIYRYHRIQYTIALSNCNHNIIALGNDKHNNTIELYSLSYNICYYDYKLYYTYLYSHFIY